MAHPQDEEIIKVILGGNPRPFAVLVDRYKDRGMTLAVRVLRNREEAEEVVQDAFVRAYRGLGQFRGEARFSTWFHRIIYNLCLTRMRSRRVRAEEVEFSEGTLADHLDGDATPPALDEMVENNELQRIIAEEIEFLPEKYRSSLTLFYVQDMSYEEIAGTMDLPIGTVKTNLHRGRRILRSRVLERTHMPVRQL